MEFCLSLKWKLTTMDILYNTNIHTFKKGLDELILWQTDNTPLRSIG